MYIDEGTNKPFKINQSKSKKFKNLSKNSCPKNLSVLGVQKFEIFELKNTLLTLMNFYYNWIILKLQAGVS